MAKAEMTLTLWCFVEDAAESHTKRLATNQLTSAQSRCYQFFVTSVIGTNTLFNLHPSEGSPFILYFCG